MTASGTNFGFGSMFSPYAAVAFGGLQRLRVAQLAWDLPMSPGLHTHPSRRRSHQHITRIRGSEIDISAAFHAGMRQTGQAATQAARVGAEPRRGPPSLLHHLHIALASHSFNIH